MEAIDYYAMNFTTKRIAIEWPKEAMILPRLKKPTKKHEYAADIAEYQRPTQRLNICKTPHEKLSAKFKRLLIEWQKQAAFLPSVTAMAILPSYQEIIGMGKPALPLILNELKERPSHLFWALRAISGVDPVPPRDRGRIDKMIKAWIKWGRKNNIIE